MLLKIYVYSWVAMFGACIGSFLNVVIYRVPQGTFFAEKRSYCPACREKLSWRELIPVVSFLLQRGKCKHCGGKISARYPLVEAACGALAVICLWRFGAFAGTPLSFGIMAVLLAVALIDYDTMEIPDSLVVALIPMAVCAIWVWRDVPLVERAIGFFVVSLPMLLLAMFVGGAFGGGDIKLMAVCGFLLGWKYTLLAFFVALLFGGGYAAFLIIFRKAERGTKIAFGPYLCVGVAVSLLWGYRLIRMYLSFFM